MAVTKAFTCFVWILRWNVCFSADGLKIEIPTGDWYCPECLEKRVRRGDAVVVSKRSGEEQVELSRDYVGNLIKSEEKKAQKRKLKKGREEEEEDEEAFQLDDNQSLDLSVF